MRFPWFGAAAASAIFTLFIGGLGWWLSQSERQLMRRPSVTGRVLAIALVEAAEASAAATGARSLNTFRRVAIEYEYVVAGHRYVGHGFSNSPPNENVDLNPRPSARMAAYLERYKVGTPISVYYDQNRPQYSYVEISTSGSRWFFLGAGAFAAVTILCLLRALLKSR